MTTTEPTPPQALETSDWYAIDHGGRPTSTGRTVTTPDLKPFATGPAVRVECVQHSDGTYDQNSLVVRVDDEEFSGEDVRKLARRLMNATDLFDEWADVTAPRAEPIKCATWCGEDDGHPGMTFAEDQTCRSTYDITILSLADQTKPGEFTSYAKQHNGEEPHVCLNVLLEDTDVDVPLTADEARRMANKLLDAAELVEGQPE